MWHRIGVDTTGNQTRIMRHIDHKIGTDFFRNLGHARPVKTQGIGRSATNEQLGFALKGNTLHLVVINFFFIVQTIRHDIEQFAGQVSW